MPTTVFGIVGGVGSGKSFTTSAFLDLGAVAFDADEQARRLFDEPTILAALRARWGDAVVSVSGEVDRRRLAERVFAPTDAAQADLNYLNATIRPFLFARFRNWLESTRAEGREIAVLDAPLLFEVGWETEVDFVVFVDATRATRERRVARRGWPSGELERREARQLPLEVKKSRADFIVDADRDESKMRTQIATVVAEARRRARENFSDARRDVGAASLVDF